MRNSDTLGGELDPQEVDLTEIKDDWRLEIITEKTKKTINTIVIGGVNLDFLVDVLNFRTDKYNFVWCDHAQDAQLIIVVYNGEGMQDEKVVENVNKYRSQAVIVYYSGENVNPNNQDSLWDELMLGLEEVDVAISFNYKKKVDLSESKKVKDYARLPYGFFGFDPETCFFDPETYKYMTSEDHYTDWVNRPRDVTFFSNHLRFPRGELYNLMSNITERVDSYGVANHNIEGMYGEWMPKIPPSRFSKFSITPENSFGDGYYTEKVFDAFLAGQVPLYWPNYPEPEMFNKHRILLYDPEYESEFIEKVEKLMNDEKFAMEFFEKPVLLPTAYAHAQLTCAEYANTMLKAIDQKIGPNEETNIVPSVAGEIEELDGIIQVKTYLAGRQTSDFMYKVLNYQHSKYRFTRCVDMANADLIIVMGGNSQYSYGKEEYDNNLVEEVNKYQSQAIIIYHGDNFKKDGGIDESTIGLLDKVDLFVSHKENHQVSVDWSKTVKGYAKLPPGFLTFDPETCFFHQQHLESVIENEKFYYKWKLRIGNIGYYSSISDFYLNPRQKMYKNLNKVGHINSHGNAYASVWERKSHVFQRYQFAMIPEKSENEVSESIFEAFIAGAIPVYWPPLNPEPEIFNEERMFFYDPNQKHSIDDMVNILKADHIAKQKKFFEKPVLRPNAKEYTQSVCAQYSKHVFNALDKKFGGSITAWIYS